MTTYASDAKIISCILSSPDGTRSKDIINLIERFDYFEDINKPSTHAKLMLSDTGENIVSSFPIQGFEKIEIEVENGDGEFTYIFRVNRIMNRFQGQRFQAYVLVLYSEEALINESIKIAATVADRPENIVGAMLQKLNTQKTLNLDPTLFKTKFHIPKRSPFSVIDYVKTRSVYGASEPKTVTSAKLPKFQNETGVLTTASSDLGGVENTDYKKAGGTAGYLFYENRTGYHFKSLETLFKSEGEKEYPSYYLEPNEGQHSPNQKIVDITFNNEIDILSKLRMGAFSSVLCTYDFSTGKYDEHVYSLADSYDGLTHLGSQAGLPIGQKELSKYPTRVMSVLTDHETWNSEATIGSPDEEDGGSSNPDYPDFQKHYLMQSIARSHTVANQQVEIKITGNFQLGVGDKINIYIPNQIPSANRTADPYDTEHSGTYLISKINHVVESKNEVGVSFLTLIRDTYGTEESSSNVK